MGWLNLFRKSPRIVPTCPYHLSDMSKNDPVAVAEWEKKQYEEKTISMVRELRRSCYFMPAGESVMSATVNSRLYQRLAAYAAEQDDYLGQDLQVCEGGLMFRKRIKIIDGGGD